MSQVSPVPLHSFPRSCISRFCLSLPLLSHHSFIAQAHSFSSLNPRWHSFHFYSFVISFFSWQQRFLRILRSEVLVHWCRFSRLMSGCTRSISLFPSNFLSGIIHLHRLYPLALLLRMYGILIVSDFGFQMTYGISTTDDPDTYIQMDSMTVSQYAQMFNFTGNLLANKFWWNVSTESLDAGSYLLTSSASFFACSDGSENGAFTPSRLFQS